MVHSSGVLIPILLAISTLVMGVIGLEMANTPPKKKKQKWRWRYAFLGNGALMLALNFAQIHNQNQSDLNKQIDFGNRIDGIRTNFDSGLEREKRELSEKIEAVTTNVIEANEIRKRYENLLNSILTNQFVSPETKQFALDSDRDAAVLSFRLENVSNWEVGLTKFASTRVQQEKQLQADQINYEKGFRCFDYAIKTLIAMSKAIASAKGDQVVVNYNGLPPTIYPSDLTNGDVGEIYFMKNKLWHLKFKITAHEPGTGSQLEVFGNGSRLAVISNGGVVLDLNGLDTVISSFPMENYKTSLQVYFNQLIANEDIKTFPSSMNGS